MTRTLGETLCLAALALVLPGSVVSGQTVERTLYGKIRVDVGSNTFKQWQMFAESGPYRLTCEVAVLADGVQIASRTVALTPTSGLLSFIVQNGFRGEFSLRTNIPRGARLEVRANASGTVGTRRITGSGGRSGQLPNWFHISNVTKRLDVGTIRVAL